MRRGMRKVARLAGWAALLGGVAAAARAALGRAAGEPGVPARRGATPLSFDAWPAVPQAPAKQGG